MQKEIWILRKSTYASIETPIFAFTVEYKNVLCARIYMIFTLCYRRVSHSSFTLNMIEQLETLAYESSSNQFLLVYQMSHIISNVSYLI